MKALPASTRVLIVDDHQMVAQMLASVLDREVDISVVGTAGSLVRALSLVDSAEPDVVLLDFHLPDAEGSQAVAAIRAGRPTAAVVMLSADESSSALQTAVGAGASGFLLKSWPLDEVPAAIRRAAAGEMLISATALANLMIEVRENDRERTERERAKQLLSAREREVLQLLAEGRDNPAIADEMGIGIATVRWHVQHVLEKLEAHSKLEAVVRAGRLGLLAG